MGRKQCICCVTIQWRWWGMQWHSSTAGAGQQGVWGLIAPNSTEQAAWVPETTLPLISIHPYPTPLIIPRHPFSSFPTLLVPAKLNLLWFDVRPCFVSHHSRQSSICLHLTNLKWPPLQRHARILFEIPTPPTLQQTAAPSLFRLTLLAKGSSVEWKCAA